MPWEPGQSGNPGGRPKKNRELENLALQHCEAAMKKAVTLMESSKDERIVLDAIKFIVERGYGKAPQALTLKTPPGGLHVRIVQFGATAADIAPAGLPGMGPMPQQIAVAQAVRAATLDADTTPQEDDDHGEDA